MTHAFACIGLGCGEYMAREKGLSMKKMILGIILVLLMAFVVIQFIPVDRSNPAVTADMPTSPEVKVILCQEPLEQLKQMGALDGFTRV
jgi:hypothetical protein